MFDQRLMKSSLALIELIVVKDESFAFKCQYGCTILYSEGMNQNDVFILKPGTFILELAFIKNDMTE